MNIINNLVFVIIIYIMGAMAYNQSFKAITYNMKNDGATIVILDIIAGLFSLLLIPLFDIKFPSSITVYLFLFIACIFYALNDRIATTARKGLEASTFSMLKQLSTVFMIFAGLIVFREKFILNKFIGAILIVIGNIIVFFDKKKLVFNKYGLYGFIACLFTTVALLIDVSYSKEFNIAFYVSFILIIPALLILIFERIKFKTIKSEFNNINKKLLLINTIGSAIMIVAKLHAYNIGKVTIVAPLCSLTIITNVFASYFILGEKKRLPQKVLAAIIIFLSLILIRL